MAIGKNKKLMKTTGPGGKKVQKRKPVDFAKKDWFRLRVPRPFSFSESVGLTVVNRSSGKFVNTTALRGRKFELNLGDVVEHATDDYLWRKFTFKIDHVDGEHCYSSFAGMRLTADRARFVVRRGRSLIDCHTDVRTGDGWVLRVFAMGQTNTAGRNEVPARAVYAKSSQVREIRARMVRRIQRDFSAATIEQVLKKLIEDSVTREIEKDAKYIYPIHNTCIFKVKVISLPASWERDAVMAQYADSKSGPAMRASSGAPDRPWQRAATTTAEEQPAWGATQITESVGFGGNSGGAGWGGDA